jgi:hypothetical protein
MSNLDIYIEHPLRRLVVPSGREAQNNSHDFNVKRGS